MRQTAPVDGLGKEVLAEREIGTPGADLSDSSGGIEFWL
jgi:hypothetical protein